MRDTTTVEGLPPPVRGGNGLIEYPIPGSILVAIVAAILLQMYNLIEFSDRAGAVITSNELAVHLLDFTFRMAMGALLVLVAVPLLHGWLRRTGWMVEYARFMRVSLGPQPGRSATAAAMSFIVLVVVLIVSAVAAGVYRFEPAVLVEGDNWLILLAALVPAIWEELAFRGLILSNLQQRFSPPAAIVISSVVFGLFHFSNLFGNWDGLGSVVAGVVAATMLGLGWAYVVIRTNSILPAMVLHYLVDVILFDELFIDPLADDDSTSIVYLAFALLYPLLTVVFTRRLYRGTSRASAIAGEAK